MSDSTQTASAAKYSVKPCGKCGAKEMQRKPRTALHKLLAIYPYLCVRCSTRQTRFRLTLGTIFKFSLFAALVGSIVYFSVNPISFRRGEDGSQNSAEALSRARTAAGGLSAFEQ